MAEIDEVAKAKSDLVAANAPMNTSCDAHRITNLAAYRNGWKLVEKTSGDNCNGRKVDGILKDGGLYDCLINAGPPLNQNEPSWNYQGPQNALVAVDPVADPIDSGGGPGPTPIPPIDGDVSAKLDVIIAMLNDAKVTQAYDTKTILDSIASFRQRFDEVVEDMESTLQKVLRYLIESGQLPGLPDVISRKDK